MAEAQLKVWRQKRGQTKRSMTILEKWIGGLPPNYKLESIIDCELKISDLKTGRLNFETYHNGITECLIELEADDEKLENHEKEFEHFEERYQQAMLSLNKMLEAARNELQVLQPHPAAEANLNGNKKVQSSLKLPEIHLPLFDGLLVNYQSFKETFRALVHNDLRLSAVQKFFYLKGCLKNTSLFAEISSLALTEENYDLAWELMVARYENKKALINKHIRYLFTLPKTERNSASSLRQLMDNVSKHIHGIKSQQIIVPDAILIYLVTSKIDELSHQLWEAHDANLNVEEMATFESLKMFLCNRARALENVEDFNQRKTGQQPVQQFGKAGSSSYPPKFHNKNNFENRNVYSIQKNVEMGRHQPNKFMSMSNGKDQHRNSQGNKYGKCVICSEEHPIWRCKTFLNKPIKDRELIVKDKRLCEKCLREHEPNACTFKFACRLCNELHNTLLHQDVKNTSDK